MTARFVDSGRLLLALAVVSATGLAVAELRDPTQPPGTDSHTGLKTGTNNSYALVSTLVSADRRVAVINGKEVTEGDAIGNATVVSIGRHDVVIQSAGRNIVLQILPDIMKTQQ